MPDFNLEMQDDLNQRSYFSDDRAGLFEAYQTSLDTQIGMLEQFAEPGRLLDMGCGDGHLLRTAHARGWSGAGVDVVDTPGQATLPDTIDFHRCELRDAPFETGSFDAMTLAQVLEHLPDPHATLVQSTRLLRAGGVLAIGVPNPEALPHTLRNLYHFCRGRLGATSYSADLHPPQHLYAFPRKTLLGALEGLGYEILRVVDAPLGDPRWAPQFRVKYAGWTTRRVIELSCDYLGSWIKRSSLTLVYAKKPAPATA